MQAQEVQAGMHMHGRTHSDGGVIVNYFKYPTAVVYAGYMLGILESTTLGLGLGCVPPA